MLETIDLLIEKDNTVRFIDVFVNQLNVVAFGFEYLVLILVPCCALKDILIPKRIINSKFFIIKFFIIHTQ